MATNRTAVAPECAPELYNLVGEDVSATLESDRNLSGVALTRATPRMRDLVQRDTDDTEDSEEEFEEEEDDDDDLGEDDEEEDEDEEEFDPDKEGAVENDEVQDGEAWIAMLQTIDSTNLRGLRGPIVNGNTSVKSELDEDDDAGNESVVEDEYVIESGNNETDSADSPGTNRAIDSALRMRALAAVTSEYATSV